MLLSGRLMMSGAQASVTAPWVVAAAVVEFDQSDSGTDTIDVSGTGLDLSLIEDDMLIVASFSDSVLLGGGGETFGGPADSETAFSGNEIVDREPGSPGRRITYMRVGETPPTTITIQANFNRNQILIFVNVRGANWATGPLDGTAQVGSDDTSVAMPDPPSYTTATENALRLIFGGIDSCSTFTATAPSGFEGLLQLRTDTVDGNAGAGLFAYGSTPGVTGALNPDIFGGTVSVSDGRVAMHFAIKGI